MDFLSVYIPPTSIPGLGSGSPYASGLSIDTMGGSGSNLNPDKDLLSALRSQPETQPADFRYHVLIVEDNEADVFLIEEAIKTAELQVCLHVVENGEQAVQFFDRVDGSGDEPCPALVILDINLPRKSGSEVLRHMRRSPRCGKAHVIAVSTSDSARDRQQMTQLGADRYFRKPSDYADFMKLGELVRGILAA